MQHNSLKHWIIVASKEHVQRGRLEGFAQACHGKVSPLKRMQQRDWVIYYSPKLKFEENQKCQAFTAIGKVVDNTVYQHHMGNNFTLFRRNIEFFNCAEVSIFPLIENLSFIQNKKHWGYIFRCGFFEIPSNDFNLIASQMLLV